LKKGAQIRLIIALRWIEIQSTDERRASYKFSKGRVRLLSKQASRVRLRCRGFRLPEYGVEAPGAWTRKGQVQEDEGE
jgi:hypothetical protein